MALTRQIGRRRRVPCVIASLSRFPAMKITQAEVTVDAGWPGNEAGQFAFVTFDRKEGAHPLPGAALACAALPAPALAHPDADAFVPSAFVNAPRIVDCTLENGAAALCYEFTVPYQPEGPEIGPFCPETLDDTGGLWDRDGENAGLHRLDRAFFEMLAAQGYRFHGADGTVAIADPAAPGGPQVDHACLMATPDESVLIPLRSPVDPVMAVCGSHIDPGGWYHWHATATDIDTTLAAAGADADCRLAQDPTTPFGDAFHWSSTTHVNVSPRPGTHAASSASAGRWAT